MEIRLGNKFAKEAYRDPVTTELLYRILPGEQVTAAHIPNEYTLGEAFQAITAPDGIWANHVMPSEDGTLPSPAWVETSSAGLTLLISENYGGIATSCPDGWDAVVAAVVDTNLDGAPIETPHLEVDPEAPEAPVIVTNPIPVSIDPILPA